MDNEKLSLPQYDIPEDIQNAVAITTLDRLYNWGRVRLCGRSCLVSPAAPSK